MEKKSQDFSYAQAQRLANTPAGKQLMQLLQQQDSAQLQKAMDLASSGNYKEASQMLQTLLASPEAKKLMQQLGGKHGGL